MGTVGWPWYLVWAASMCLTVDVIADCQLEEGIGALQLEKKLAPTSGQEVGPGGYCSPRHGTHFKLPFLEFSGVL